MNNGKNKSFKTGFTKFMSGRGFYVALAVCLIGTGTAAWVAVDRTLGSINESNSSILENQASSTPEERTWGFGDTEEAGKGENGVIVSSAPSSSVPTASSSSAASTKPQDPSVSSAPQETPQNSAFILPINGEIFGQFSNGKLVQDPTLKEWKTHNGIDIRAEKGAAVVAVADGTIANIYSDPMWGTTVEISHPQGLTSIYCGLSKDLPIKKGQAVKMNQQIGSVDQIPAEISLGDHLHLGMKRDGKWCDPLAAMGKTK